MAKYVVRQKVDKSGNKEKIKYYGVPVASSQITVEYIADEISQQSSLTPEDVISAIGALARQMRKHLADGNTVYLKDIGLFVVSASSEGCDLPEDCTPGKIKAQRIYFKADKRMKSVLPDMKFELVRENKP